METGIGLENPYCPPPTWMLVSWYYTKLGLDNLTSRREASYQESLPELPRESIFFFNFFFFICGGFCHTLKWNSHGFTCVPHPDPPSHLPVHPLPLGFPSAPGPSACLMHPTWAESLFITFWGLVTKFNLTCAATSHLFFCPVKSNWYVSYHFPEMLTL